MKTIDTTKWKEFKLCGDGGIFSLKRGKRLTELDRIGGDVEYYSASEYNNGLTDFIDNPLFIEKNSLIYTTFGKCFFVKNDFTCSDEINILKNKNINLYNGLFISTILNQNKYKYSFGRKAFENKLITDYIKLPSKDNEPDWEYMENYIKELSSKIKYDKQIIKNKNKINTQNFKEFRIDEIFDPIKKGERLVVIDRLIGETLFLTATSKNNGVTELINKEYFINSKKLFKNKITIDMFCNVFYQEKEYFSDDNIHTLFFKNKDYAKYYENVYIQLFLTTILKKIIVKYNYGRQVRLKRFLKETIILPIKQNNEIDFEYMESYIKSFNYSSLV